MFCVRKSCLSVACLVLATAARSALGANAWDGGGGNNWWFDYVNWGLAGVDTVVNPLTDGLLPPNNALTPLSFNDAQINVGSGAWDVTGEGVVFDPAHDPYYTNPDVVDNNVVDGADFLALQRAGIGPGNWQRQYTGAGYGAEDMAYPTGSFDVGGGGGTRNYGPQTIYRLYISRNTTNSNTLTIKSGDLAVGSTIIIGRSGSSVGNDNLGRVVQTGGIFRIPSNTLDMGQAESSGYGNGTYDYRGGTLEVQQVGGTQGIRLSGGSSSNGSGGTGRFIMHNPTTGGRVHTFDFTVAAFAGGPTGATADGVTRGVGIVEFHVENGGTRPIQVDRNLTINNGVDDPANATNGTRSSRLELVLDSAPTVDGGGVPQNLGLFDVDFGGVFSGVINGTGDLNNDMVYNNDRVFSNADATAAYYEGDTVSAVFGGTQYNWTISYTGDISWTDAENSVVSTISGAGSGTDVVLIGLSSSPVANTVAAVPEPASLALAFAAAAFVLGRRRRLN